jgi:hypothetical protein
MNRYRGSDEALEREIAAVQGLVRLRVRRTNADLRELELALRDLRRERARRRGVAPATEVVAASSAAST